MTLTASNIALKGTLRDATRPLALRYVNKEGEEWQY
jgi:hypothetical protein